MKNVRTDVWVINKNRILKAVVQEERGFKGLRH